MLLGETHIFKYNVNSRARREVKNLLFERLKKYFTKHQQNTAVDTMIDPRLVRDGGVKKAFFQVTVCFTGLKPLRKC